mmetsp:Transcript_30991/g.52969  ORF Transcript_30991/g.52969 Transcript_30991/m.52969 type:complete len:293 (-) Transcript_30991:208-1086(-)|eukprot:CAMPEP_0183733954 /NCGR_PEP_ID=MMETSP0737-20130205/42504_1 /TAXON_ID=385413 /ORGANISM="Thalassiosira miniscula, Strain CCMP1093" /LENGTH=292 /DNA_ID=CAMNT_0025967329 /DNA_START=33 /DNA_END=911 /DNA_ORIENTATION=-
MVSTIELVDRFESLLHLESTTYQLRNYLLPNSKLYRNNGHADASEEKQSWRARVCGWMYHVVDNHTLDRELVWIALSYMDRYLSNHPFLINCCDAYQLVGMTSLYMAIKIYRIQGKVFMLSSFAEPAQDLFSEKDFLDMEKGILKTLKWRVHPPTPQSYSELLITFLPRKACYPFTRRALYERVKFLLEMSVTVPYFFAKKPSSIAVAAFIEVMEHKQGPCVPKQSCRSHFQKCAQSIGGIRCDSDEVIECREGMKMVYRNALPQMNNQVMSETEYSMTPIASENVLSVVTP